MNLKSDNGFHTTDDLNYDRFSLIKLIIMLLRWESCDPINHILVPVISQDLISTTGVTSAGGTAYPSGALVFTSICSGVRVIRPLIVYVFCRSLSFCTFSFCHCVVCFSTLYRFWLPFDIFKLFFQRCNVVVFYLCSVSSAKMRRLLVFFIDGIDEEGWDRYNPAPFLCMSQARIWISKSLVVVFCVQWVKMRGNYSFCSYRLNWWPLLIKLYFH